MFFYKMAEYRIMEQSPKKRGYMRLVTPSAKPEDIYFCEISQKKLGIDSLWLEQSRKFSHNYPISSELIYYFSLCLEFELHRRKNHYYIFLKTLTDPLIAALGLILLFPFLATCAILLKIDSSGPVFFTQLRAGKRGRPFRIFKFRTLHEIHTSNLRPFSKPLEKLAGLDDNRSTRIGRIIRNWKIDELPQLINVLKGEMSLVGPRPLPLADSTAIPRHYWKRPDQNS